MVQLMCCFICENLCYYPEAEMVDKRTNINFKPLWKLLIDKDISKTKLREITKIAPSTFSKMSNNEYVALDVLIRICVALNCGIDDIIEIDRNNT